MWTDAYPKIAVLKNARKVTIRPLGRGDFEKLYAFFQDLPEEDRLFLRHDVGDPELIRRWTEEPDFARVLPLVAEHEGRIVADGTLHITRHGWMQHVGHLRLAVAVSHRRAGLGAHMARELVSLAEDRKLEKLQVHLIEDHPGPIRMFQAVGFEVVAVIKDLVKDRDGRKRNLAVMINDVAHLGRLMEDWIQDSMIPAYRVPGAEMT